MKNLTLTIIFITLLISLTNAQVYDRHCNPNYM